MHETRIGEPAEMRAGYPTDDGWGWLYELYDRHIAPHDRLREPLCAYLNRTCVFELAHLPFFLALLALTIYRWMQGEYALASADALINLLVNF
jgi:hypothetical protein